MTPQAVNEMLPDISQRFCVIVLSDRDAQNGEVLGNPNAENRLVIYNENNVHFIVALRCRFTVTSETIVEPVHKSRRKD